MTDSTSRQLEFTELHQRVLMLEDALNGDHLHTAVADIDKILRAARTLRRTLVTENRRRQDAFMAKLDEKYGPITTE